MNIPLYAVIPSGFRHQELVNLVKVLIADDVHVFIVNTGYDVETLNGLGLGTPENPTLVIQDFREPKNISRWWNVGLSAVASSADWDSIDDYVVAVLNDDVIIQRGFVQQLADAIFKYGAAAASPDRDNWYGEKLHTKVIGSPMTGYAFALRGSKNIRADESLVWWYGDNDIAWQAIQAGGLVTVPGLFLQHLYPNSTTINELAVQAAKDRETFVTKWSTAPW